MPAGVFAYIRASKARPKIVEGDRNWQCRRESCLGSASRGFGRNLVILQDDGSFADCRKIIVCTFLSSKDVATEIRKINSGFAAL